MDRSVWVDYLTMLGGKLHIQNSSGTLYPLASQPFAATRLQLQDAKNDELVLLDISTNKGEYIRKPVYIIHEEKRTSDTKPNVVPRSLSSTPLLVVLTRYATQMLYAPLRTVEPSPDVQLESMRLTKTIATLLPALPISTMPIGSWKLDLYHLAATRL